jgi:hypothetical protein
VLDNSIDGVGHIKGLGSSNNDIPFQFDPLSHSTILRTREYITCQHVSMDIETVGRVWQ